MSKTRAVRKLRKVKTNCKKNKTCRKSRKAKSDCKRNCRRTRKYGGSPCLSSTPTVGAPWSANGPTSNIYANKPWHTYNNSNHYGLSKTGINPGGNPVYYKNFEKNFSVLGNLSGGSKKRRSKKKKIKKRENI